MHGRKNIKLQLSLFFQLLSLLKNSTMTIISYPVDMETKLAELVLSCEKDVRHIAKSLTTFTLCINDDYHTEELTVCKFLYNAVSDPALIYWE